MGIDISSSSDHCKYYYPLKTRCSASEITDLLRKRNYHYFYMKWISSWPEGPGVRTPPPAAVRGTREIDAKSKRKFNCDQLQWRYAIFELHARNDDSTPPPMASGINIYSFFSDIRNNYSRYLEKNYFGYPKTGTYFIYPK